MKTETVQKQKFVWFLIIITLYEVMKLYLRLACKNVVIKVIECFQNNYKPILSQRENSFLPIIFVLTHLKFFAKQLPKVIKISRISKGAENNENH